MATEYVYHGGDGTTGADWTTAWQNINDASLLNGNIIIIAKDHVDANSPYSADQIIAGPSSGEPVALVTADRTTDEYTRATVSHMVTDSLKDISLDGSVTVSGLQVEVADDFKLTSDANEAAQFFEVKVIGATGSALNIANSNNTNSYIDFEFTGVIAAPFTGAYNMGDFIDLKLPSSVTTIFAKASSINVSSSNFSAMTNPTIVELNSNSCSLIGCSMPASFTHSSDADGGQEVLIHGSDSTTGNNVYRHEKKINAGGFQTVSTSIHMDNGSKYDDSTGYSLEFDSSSYVNNFNPCRTEWVDGHIGASGSKTFTVDIVSDNAAALTDLEAWLEIEVYLSASHTQTTFLTDRKVDLLGTGVAQTASSATWTGTSGFTNEQKQELSIAATVARAGGYRWRVAFGKPSSSLNINMKMAVT